VSGYTPVGKFSLVFTTFLPSTFAASSFTFSAVGKSKAIVLSAARSSNLGLAPPLVWTLITVST